MWLPWLVESFPLINVNSQRKKNQKRNCSNNINIYQRTKGKPKGHSLHRSEPLLSGKNNNEDFKY